MFKNPSNEALCDILKEAKTIAVVGLSDNPARESYGVAREMQRRGYRIIPVNPGVQSVLNEKAYPSLADVEEPIDIINVFRRSDALKDVVLEAVETSAPVIWAQLGVYDEEASQIAASSGKTMVMDACIKVVHSRCSR